MDPVVPDELKDLLPVEKLIISRIIPTMHVYWLKHGGQLCYKSMFVFKVWFIIYI